MLNDTSANDLSFAALDELLDHALDLDEAALAAFLGSLGQTQRAALQKLLNNANSSELSRAGEEVRNALNQVIAGAAGTESKAGDWQLKREIGAGGTGQVFYAERRNRQEAATKDHADAFVQRAAVKVLWSHRVRSQFRDRFLRERRILASIDHPGLARFLDGGLLGDGRPWFAMEYVEGVSIVDFAQSLPIKQRLALFLDVVDTIDYAHQRLIVHRDIKPQNILVDTSGRPRVLDFGIARILGESDEKDLTLAQGTPLTLQYASPEQVSGQTIDVASDVYQLGLLLFELLTATKPYRIDESSLRTAIDIICRQSPPPPSERADQIDSDLDAIVSKALRKNPIDRFASAAALAADLRRFIAGRPISARPQSNWYVLTRFLRRNAVPSALVAGSVAALSLAVVLSVRSAQQARAEAERSQTTQRILADVFEQANPFGAGGAEVSLADALIRARPSIEAKVADDPRLGWEVNKTLAEIFTQLDMQDLERDAYQAAWNAAVKLQGNNEREVLFAVAGLASILARDDPSKALDFLAKHLPASPATGRSALVWLSAKYAEVNALIRLRDFERADIGAHEMDRVASTFSVDAPRTLGRIDQLLAGAAQRAGKPRAADAYWESAVTHMRRAETPFGLAVTLSNQALHYGKTGRYAQADAVFQESISIFRRHAPRDSTHANVQRLYAGLLFRMQRTDEALDALEKTQSMLDPGKQSYEYFVAQLDRARFAFVAGNIALSLDAIERGVRVAAPSFGPDADVTQRIIPVFARVLLFADRPTYAARLLMGRDPSRSRQLCAHQSEDNTAIDDAIRVLEDDAGTEAARQALWKAIEQARSMPAPLDANAESLAAAITAYRANQSPFLDVLDRHSLLSTLDAIGQAPGQVLPADLQGELERLRTLKADSRETLGESDSGRLRELLTALGVMSEAQFNTICATSARPAVVSTAKSR